MSEFHEATEARVFNGEDNAERSTEAGFAANRASPPCRIGGSFSWTKPAYVRGAPAGLCAHGGVGDMALKKRYSIAPSSEGAIEYYFKSPHPGGRTAGRLVFMSPPPLEGRGSQTFLLQVVRRGGVINDSIHIFRQRKIWIPFSPQTSFASLRPDFHAPSTRQAEICVISPQAPRAKPYRRGKASGKK